MTVHQLKKNKKEKDKRIVLTVFAPKRSKRVFLPASATVEAALVIPLYIYAVLAIVYVIQMTGIQSTMYKAVYDSTRQLARYTYAVEKSGVTSGSSEDASESDTESIKSLTAQTGGAKASVTSALARQYLLGNLPADYEKNNKIQGGTAGIQVHAAFSQEADNEICLKVTYRLNNPFDVFGIGAVKITQQCSSAAWLGQAAGEDGSDTDSNERVYITAQGTVYHKSRACTYLNPSIRQITQEQLDTARNSSGAKYYLCERCGGRSSAGIYITDYGDRYHYDRNCSGLKRSILCVPLSQVQDKSPCSKCSGGNDG